MLYKIVHRHHGSTPYWCETLGEAMLMLKQIVLSDKEDEKQYYIREIK